MNSVNDNPLIDAERDEVYHTGNFYGGHIARMLDGAKIDIANLANWAHCLMAMLMDPRFSNGLPASLAIDPGLSSGFKGMQLAQTSLVVACRQMAGPSSIHTLPTEQYNQDIVSLGMHAAMGANDMTARLRDALSILILALCQAADLRGVGEGRERLGRAGAGIYAATRRAVAFRRQGSAHGPRHRRGERADRRARLRALTDGSRRRPDGGLAPARRGAYLALRAARRRRRGEIWRRASEARAGRRRGVSAAPRLCATIRSAAKPNSAVAPARRRAANRWRARPAWAIIHKIWRRAASSRRRRGGDGSHTD